MFWKGRYFQTPFKMASKCFAALRIKACSSSELSQSNARMASDVCYFWPLESTMRAERGHANSITKMVVTSVSLYEMHQQSFKNSQVWRELFSTVWNTLWAPYFFVKNKILNPLTVFFIRLMYTCSWMCAYIQGDSYSNILVKVDKMPFLSQVT